MATFEARLPQAALFKKIVDAMKELVREAVFDCTPNAFQLQAMDASHIALCALKLRSTGFSAYTCSQNLSLFLDLEEVAKVLKLAANDDSMTISANSDSNDDVTFMFEGDSQVASFEIKQVSIDADRLGVPDTQYSAEVTLPARKFQSIVRDLSPFGDSVSISVSKDGVSFSISGQSTSGCLTLSPGGDADDEGNKVSVLVREPVNLSFHLRYLNFFTKATALSSTVKLSLGPKVPLLVSYDIEEIGWVRYYLAPKQDAADDDDDDDDDEDSDDDAGYE